LAITIGVGIKTVFTSLTFVNFTRLAINCSIIDLGRLTVFEIDIDWLTLILNSTARRSVLGQGKWILTGKALGLGTDSAFSVESSTSLALHSLAVFTGSVGNHGVLWWALVASLVSVTVSKLRVIIGITGTVHSVSIGTISACGCSG
jgi:hypothetical protein